MPDNWMLVERAEKKPAKKEARKIERVRIRRKTNNFFNTEIKDRLDKLILGRFIIILV